MNKPPTRLLRKASVTAKTGLSGTTIWRLTRDGTFPKPVRLAVNGVGWVEGEVDAWISARVDARDKGVDEAPAFLEASRPRREKARDRLAQRGVSQ